MKKEYLALAGKAVESKLPDNHGFILMVIPFEGSGDNRLRYVSSIHREQALKVVKKWLYHNGEKENWMEHIK